MADKKITDLTADTSPTGDDLIPTVNDPGGTPANRKVALADAIQQAHGLGDGAVSISAGTMVTTNVLTAQSVQTQNMVSVNGSTGNISFSNSNGITFGGNASTITASHNGITSQSVQTQGMVSINGGTGDISFSNSNGISFGRNASTITASYTVPSTAGLISAINISGGTTSNNLSKVTFSDSNGVSFGLNGSVLTATVKTDYQSSNANYLTSQSNQAFSASGGSSAFQTLNFANSNGLTFSNSNGSVIGSYTVPTVTDYFSKTNTTFNGTNVSGSITLNTNGLRIDVSAGAGGAGDGVNILAAGTQTANTTGTVAFSNSNGITFGMSNSSVITASHNGLTTAAQSNQVVNSINGSTGQISLATGSSLSSSSNGSTITFGLASNITTALQSANANYLTSQSNQAFSASGGSSAFQTLNFANSNGLTFSNSNGSVIGSYTVPTVTDYFSKTNTTFNGANISGSLTLNTNGLNVSLSAAAPGGGGSVTVSASNGSFSGANINFSNANNVTFGTSAGSIVTASVAAPGAAAENNWFALTGANTAGNTTASGSTIGLSGINLTLSGTNGSGINISAPATSSLSATGGLSISTNGSTISMGVPGDLTLSYYNPQDAYLQVAGQLGASTLMFQPMQAPNVQFDRIAMPLIYSNASNSSNSVTVSVSFGLYTRNSDSLSLYQSTIYTTNMSGSGTVGANYSNFGGLRLATIPFTSTLTEGQYWAGIVSRTTTGGGAGMTISNVLASQMNSSFSGIMGQASNATIQYTRGLGKYSANTTAFPSAVAFSEIYGNSSAFLRKPLFYFVSGTF